MIFPLATTGSGKNMLTEGNLKRWDAPYVSTV